MGEARGQGPQAAAGAEGEPTAPSGSAGLSCSGVRWGRPACGLGCRWQEVRPPGKDTGSGGNRVPMGGLAFLNFRLRKKEILE